MPVYTVTVKGICGGGTGGHITLAVRKDGAAFRDVVVHRSDVMDRNIELEEILPFLLRNAIKQAGATTLAQAKVAVEAASWKV